MMQYLYNIIVARLNALNKVPAQNSIDNATIKDVIGGKTDDHDGNSLYSRIETIYDHAHHVCKVYPTLANGKLITGGTPAWALGAFAVVVPANTIPNPFDIHFVNIEAYSASDSFELVMYAGADGAEVEVGRTRFTRITNVGAPPLIYFSTPIIPANAQIKAKVASETGNNDTVTISINYNEY